MILSAGIVIVRRQEKEWKFLFLRAYRNWDFPKGIVETGEDPLETAKREVAEETGLSDLNFRWGHIYRGPSPIPVSLEKRRLDITLPKPRAFR